MVWRHEDAPCSDVGSTTATPSQLRARQRLGKLPPRSSPAMNLKVRTLAALAFAALASTLSAPAALAAAHHHHHAVDRASYPMKADEFRQSMEKRIDRVRAA